MRRLVLSVSFAVLLGACDRRSDGELRAMMTELVTEQTRATKDQLSALETKVLAKDAEITDLNARMDARVDALEAALAAANARLDALGKPPASVVPVVAPAAAGPEAALYKMSLGDAHVRGPETALVTIVVWSDFECPHCAKVDATFDRIEAAYGADVRLAFKHCPLASHPRARPAALAAEAAGAQDKFWEMHDELFEHAKDLSDANFAVWAKALGLDGARFAKDLGDAALERRVDAQREECTRFGVGGVPSYYVNGRLFEGENSFESLQPVIEDRLREARALVVAGTARTAVYDAVIASGRTGA